RNGRTAGSLGTAATFSFFPTKNLGGFGDGGLITTNDEQIAAAVRSLRVHGQNNFGKYLHQNVGTNSRLDELQAAILRVKMKYLQQWNQKRTQNAHYYYDQLRAVPIELPQVDPQNKMTFHQFVIRTEKRDALREHLQKNGIGTAIYY